MIEVDMLQASHVMFGCFYTTVMTQQAQGCLPCVHLQVVFLGNSGSEANDLALRIASAASAAAAARSPTTGSSSSSSSVQDHVVVMAGAYHGHLSSLITLRCEGGPGGGECHQEGGCVCV